MRKIFSFIMAVVMFGTIPMQALATSNDSEVFKGGESIDNQYSVNVFEEGGTRVDGQDLPNGDAVFTQYENGQMISKNTVHRLQNTIEMTYYESGIATETNIVSIPNADQSASVAPLGVVSGRPWAH